MNLHHDKVLADLEARAVAGGTPPDEIDAAIAEALGVPVAYYLAYLCVWGALEAHRHTDTPGEHDVPPGSHELAEAVAGLRRFVDRSGWLGVRLYRQALGIGPPARELANTVGALLGCVLELRRRLRLLDGGPTPPPRRGHSDGRVVAR